MRILFILAILLMKSCEVSDDRLKIENKSSEAVYYVFSKGYKLNNIERVNLFRDANNRLDTLYDNYLSPHSITTISNTVPWEGYVETTPGERINFFFFSIDTLSNYSWEDIVQGNMYSAMASYTIEDLKKMNWKIIYPVENYKPPTKSLIPKEKSWFKTTPSLDTSLNGH